MIEFSVDNYNIVVFVGQPPDILNRYLSHAKFVDDKGLQNEGTEVYIIISNGFLPDYTVIAFRSDPVGYAGFKPGLHYEKDTGVLFIGAGSMIKTYNLATNSLIFEQNEGMGFWGWAKHKQYVIQQEEIAFGIFDSDGRQLWETFVSPPYEFEFLGDTIILKFDGIRETRKLSTGDEVIGRQSDRKNQKQ